MTIRKMDLERTIRSEDLHGWRLFYEIYPMPISGAADTQNEWFEIVLHIEVEEHRALDHPESHRASSILTSLADLLIQSAKSYAPFGLEMPASYYTLHPPGSGHPAPPLLARTISLVFSEIAPNEIHDGLGILARLKLELALLGVPHLQSASDGGCR